MAFILYVSDWMELPTFSGSANAFVRDLLLRMGVVDL